MCRDDNVILQLEFIGLQALQIHGSSGACRALQRAAISLLQSLFHIYPRHRSLILDDLLADVQKFQESREFHVTATLQPGGHDVYIQMLSATILSLVQACWGSSDDEEHPKVPLFLNSRSHPTPIGLLTLTPLDSSTLITDRVRVFYHAPLKPLQR